MHMTPLYIASLVLFAGVMYALFYGYSVLLGRRLPILKNVVGGWIGFLAVNEMVALPFLMFHRSFRLFYPVFLAMNGAVLIVALISLWRQRFYRPAKWPVKLSLLGAAALVMVLLNAGATQRYVKYEADDSFYVGLIQQNFGNAHLYSADPSTGRPSFPFPAVYMFESWELLETSIAKTFGLSALEVAHGLLPLVAVVVAFSAYRLVFGTFFRERRNVYLALVLLGILFLFGGYSRYSQGTFLLSRGWLGKAELATIAIPFLLYVFLRLWQRPKDNHLYAALLVVSVAVVALNPAVVFVVGAALAVMGVQLMLRQRSLVPGIKIAGAALPLLLAGIGVALVQHARSVTVGATSEAITSGTFTWASSVRAFVGSSWYFYLMTVGLAALLWSKAQEIRRNTRALVFFTVLFAILIANPLLFGMVSKFTATTYWRLYWLIPMPILLPVTAVVVMNIGRQRLRRLPGVVVWPVLAMVCGAVFVLGGTWLFGSNQPLAARDTTRQKLPIHVYDVLEYMTQQPSGNVVAAGDVAAYYHTVPTTQQIFISRSIYYAQHCGHGSSVECRDQLRLYRVANARTTITEVELAVLLHKYHIRYFIVNSRVQSSLLDSYRTVYKNPSYTVVKI